MLVVEQRVDVPSSRGGTSAAEARRQKYDSRFVTGNYVLVGAGALRDRI
jgi:hypothetical protein